MFIPTYLPAAAGAGVGVGSNNPDTKNPFTINGLTLNNPSDSPDSTYEIVAVSVNDQYILATEGLPQIDGMQSYIPRKARKIIQMDGIVKATSLAALEYKVMQLHRYLDPINAFWDDTSSTMSQDKGFLALAFSVPTTDTSTYATGVIAIKAYVRAIQRPVAAWTKGSGYNARFRLVLEMIDPRFYESSAQSVTLAAGNTNHTSVTEYPTFPTISLTLSSAGASNVTITRSAPTDENGNSLSVHLDLTSTLLGSAAASTDVVTIDMKRGIVKLNGTERPDFLVGGYMGFFPILPGLNTIAIGGTTTYSAATAAYNRAYA